MSKEPDGARLRELENKLAKMRTPQKPDKSHQEEHYSQANHAWRMVTELVAGLGIGFGIGLGLDALTGWTPLFLVLFTLLGFAAGVNVMMRTAAETEKERKAAEAAKDHGADGLDT